MTRQEFEQEFDEKIKCEGYHLLPWHDHVRRNLHKMSDEALHFIAANCGNPFGGWMVEKAMDLAVFEDIVLRGDDEHQRP